MTAAPPVAPPITLRLGTRGSALALAQAGHVRDLARTRLPGLALEPVVVQTEGDLDKTSPLTVIGGRGVFTSALEGALLRGEVDAAVHSAKDLPSVGTPGLAFAAFLAREDPRDVFVSRHGLPLRDLPPNPTVGTSSRRRAVQVRALRPDARIVDLRGNVDTRLRKAGGKDLDGIVLAAAGLARLGRLEAAVEILPLRTFVPAPGQGALALEVRAGDPQAADLAALDEPPVSAAVRAERAFLRAIGAGCTTPVGAHVLVEEGGLRLLAMLASDDGARAEWAEEVLPAEGAEAAAGEVARRLHARVVARTVFSAAPAPASAAPRVLVTRAREQAVGLTGLLRAAGAEPIELPAIRIGPPADPEALAGAAAAMARGDYDWVVFTSGNAVEPLLRYLPFTNPALGGARFAAVGAGTAARLDAAGMAADLVPAVQTGAGMLAALVAAGVRGRRVLVPRGDLARDDLVDGLRAAGAAVDAVEAYRTVPETELDPIVRARVAAGGVDAALFASPSAVRNVAALLGGSLAQLAGVAVVCVGPTTAEAARAHGLAVAAVAERPGDEGLVAAVLAALARRALPDDRTPSDRAPAAPGGPPDERSATA